MTRRLPPAGVLLKLSNHDVWAVLATHAREVRDEIERLENGDIWASGTTRAKALTNARRRLRRVYRVADEFGVGVGQP